MDALEATKIVFSRIQSLDPENTSKIMGYLLIQDHGEKEIIRLAYGPDSSIHSLILNAKTHLGLSSSNPPTPSTPSSPSPFSSRPAALSIPNPSSPSATAWPLNSTSPLSYASIVNGGPNITNGPSGSFPSSLSSAAAPYANNCNVNDSEFLELSDHLSFLNDSKPEDLFDPRLDLAISPNGFTDSSLHRRSFSVPGMCLGSEDLNSGIGWKPCLYYARGFCKNGASCRFLHHGDCADAGAINVGSPSKLNEFEQCQELLRSKALQQQQQQKLAAASQLMGGASSFPYNKCLNYFLQQQNENQRSAAAHALMMSDEFQKLGRARAPERNDFSAMAGLGGSANPGSRQIYLTFPADSTFREEDVSNYFSMYGPVQDVRIPYQQKRMFGFVTFVYPETVKLILAKGNPHFVCDSRVLVKPYKEKGKVQDKKQHPQLERGEYSASSSPSGLDSRDPFDLPLGARMFYNTQEMLLRRKLEEQVDLQQAIELQGRRLMNLQLLDSKNQQQQQHLFHHGLSTGSPVPSPTVSHGPNDNALIFPFDGINGQELPEENGGSSAAAADADKKPEEANPACNENNENVKTNDSKGKAIIEESDLPESLEHMLPDSFFASPKKSAGDQLTVFSTASTESDEKSASPPASCSNSSSSSLSTMKSCFLQMPRFSSEHEAIGM